MTLAESSRAYNDALNAGYSKETAGLTSLATMAAMYTIMRYNEAAGRGFGTWMLDKTAGVNMEASRAAVVKPVRKLLNDKLVNV